MDSQTVFAKVSKTKDPNHYGPLTRYIGYTIELRTYTSNMKYQMVFHPIDQKVFQFEAEAFKAARDQGFWPVFTWEEANEVSKFYDPHRTQAHLT